MASNVPAEKEPSFRVPVKVEVPPAPAQIATKLEQLVGEVAENKTTGFYPYIDAIKPKDLLLYLIIIQTCVLIFSRIPFELRHLFGFLLGLFLVIILHERQRTQLVDEMTLLEIKMESINPKPTYFYIDANIVDVVYTMMEFRQVSPKNFKTMVMSIDNILSLRLDVEKGIVHCGRMYTVAMDNYEKAMNSIMGIMVGLTTDNIRLKKLKLARENLQIMLLRHLDYIRNTCNEQLKDIWHIHTQPIVDHYKSYDLVDKDMNILF